jgi:hypothetical protein
MNRKLMLIFAVILITGMSAPELHAQGILKRIKEKAEEKVIDKVLDPDESKNDQPENRQESDRSGKPTNTRGGGLEQTAPDVLANVGDARSSYGNKKYNDARFAIRQAILGIEMEIGEEILKGLPTSISNLPKLDEEDRVTSSGIGFVGLMIERTYRSDDKQLKVTVGNDSGLLTAANMYLMSGAYGTSSTDQSHKTVRVNDYRGVLEYDDYSGYKLSVPFGQSSIMVLEALNFEREAEIMSAAEKIDIENIKKTLGEQ